MARRGNDWTAGHTDRRRKGLKAVDTDSLTRVVKAVAFDQFVLDPRG
ncbi:MAG: hypothetical protein ACR2O6_12290 [Ilumatobacteraceae bacterium]